MSCVNPQHHSCGASARVVRSLNTMAKKGKSDCCLYYITPIPVITMYKIIASLYRFNMRGANRSIPYFATLTNLLALFTLCFFIIIVLLNMQSVLNFWHTGSKSEDYLIGAIVAIPLYLLMFLLFPERKMKEQEALLTKKEYKLGLFCYVLLLIILMIIFLSII